jgi:hypothetical protein
MDETKIVYKMCWETPYPGLIDWVLRIGPDDDVSPMEERWRWHVPEDLPDDETAAQQAATAVLAESFGVAVASWELEYGTIWVARLAEKTS